MDNLRACVQQLDVSCVPQFLDQVSEARENEASPQFAISMYSELAQVHKQDIVPYIPRIMVSIIRSLSHAGGSTRLHEACAKVVSSVARFTVDPNNLIEHNREILYGLCTPLLSAICSDTEASVSAGAATCLRALVESEKWKYADSGFRDRVCSKISLIITERSIQSVSLLHLLKSLTKFCAEAAQNHASQWLNLGLECLKMKDLSISASFQRRIAGAQLVSTVLKALAVQNLDSDLQTAKEILLANQADWIPGVRAAVTEALEALGERRQHFDVISDHSSPIGAESLQCQIRRNNLSMEEVSLQSLTNSPSYCTDADSLAVRTYGKYSASYSVKDAAKWTCRDSSDSPNLSSTRGDSTEASPERISAETRIPANVACLQRSISLGCHNKAYISALQDSEFGGDISRNADGFGPTNASGILCINRFENEGEGKSVTSLRFGKSGDDDNKQEMSFYAEAFTYDANKTVRHTDDVLCNGCTDILLTPDSKVNDQSGDMQDAKTKLQISVGEFNFTTPKRLHALQSGDLRQMERNGGDDALKGIKPSIAETELDLSTPTYRVSPSSSCCTSEGIKSNEDRESQLGRRLKSRNKRINNRCLCKLLDDCRFQASDDAGSCKASELLRRSLSSMDSQRVARLSIDLKIGEHDIVSDPELAKTKESQYCNYVGRVFYKIFAVAVIMLAIMFFPQMHQYRQLHALVPT